MKAYLLGLAPSILALAVGLGALSPDEAAEPPLRFELDVAGRTVPVEAGRPFTLELGGEAHEATLRALATRRLSVRGATFEYPANMSFEFEGDADMRIWTLDGNDAVVMLFRFAEPPDFADFIAEQRASYEEFGEVSGEEATIELDGTSIAGAAVQVQGEAFALHVECYPLGQDGGSEQVLMLQDVRDELDVSSEEFARVREGLARSFRFESE